MDDHSDNSAVAQGDIAVNLFMVLLSVLAALVIVAAVASPIGFRKPMIAETANNENLGLVPGWAPVPQARQRLAARADGLWLINLDGLAEALAERKRFLPDTSLDNSTVMSSDPDPQAHIVSLDTDTDPLPTTITQWKLDVDALQDPDFLPLEWTAFLSTGPEIDILVFPGGEAQAWDVARDLQMNGSPFRLLFQIDNRIRFQRSTARFTFEDVYR
jgi:hypothetical protein